MPSAALIFATTVSLVVLGWQLIQLRFFPGEEQLPPQPLFRVLLAMSGLIFLLSWFGAAIGARLSKSVPTRPIRLITAGLAYVVGSFLVGWIAAPIADSADATPFVLLVALAWLVVGSGLTMYYLARRYPADRNVV